jgi:hypothetical protein
MLGNGPPQYLQTMTFDSFSRKTRTPYPGLSSRGSQRPFRTLFPTITPEQSFTLTDLNSDRRPYEKIKKQDFFHQMIPKLTSDETPRVRTSRVLKQAIPRPKKHRVQQLNPTTRGRRSQKVVQ